MDDNDGRADDHNDVEGFLSKFRSYAHECVKNVYTVERELVSSNTNESAPTLLLSQDIIFVIDGQMQGLNEHIVSMNMEGTPEGDAIREEGVWCLLHALWCKQIYYRDVLLCKFDFDECCAAANDFVVLMESLEEWIMGWNQQYPALKLFFDNEIDSEEQEELNGNGNDEISKKVEGRNEISRDLSDLLSLYGVDATYALQRASSFLLDALQESANTITPLFSADWELKYMENQIVKSMVQTTDEFMDCCELLIESDVMKKRFAAFLISATASYYLRAFLQKMEALSKRRNPIVNQLSSTMQRLKSPPTNDAVAEDYQQQEDADESRGEEKVRRFSDPAVAITTMSDDIFIMKSSFKPWVLQMPHLDVVIEKEFTFLIQLHQVLDVAIGRRKPQDDKDEISHLRTCIKTMHSVIHQNTEWTRSFLFDACHFVAPSNKTMVTKINGILDLLPNGGTMSRYGSSGNMRGHCESEEMCAPTVLAEFYDKQRKGTKMSRGQQRKFSFKFSSNGRKTMFRSAGATKVSPPSCVNGATISMKHRIPRYATKVRMGAQSAMKKLQRTSTTLSLH